MLWVVAIQQPLTDTTTSVRKNKRGDVVCGMKEKKNALTIDSQVMFALFLLHRQDTQQGLT